LPFFLFDTGSSPTRETSFSSCEDCIYVLNHIFFVQYQCLNMYKIKLHKISWLAVIMDVGLIYKFSKYACRIIRNVFNFCKAEKVRGTFLLFDLSSVWAAAMTGVSRASLYRVVSEIEFVDYMSYLCKSFLFDMIFTNKNIYYANRIKRKHYKQYINNEI